MITIFRQSRTHLRKHWWSFTSDSFPTIRDIRRAFCAGNIVRQYKWGGRWGQRERRCWSWESHWWNKTSMVLFRINLNQNNRLSLGVQWSYGTTDLSFQFYPEDHRVNWLSQLTYLGRAAWRHCTWWCSMARKRSSRSSRNRSSPWVLRTWIQRK